MDISSEHNQSSSAEHTIDQIDSKITAYLQEDGRISYSYIAREVGVPEATVRYRVKRLLDNEIIKISAFINTGKLKYENVAQLELEVDPSFFDKLLGTLIAMAKVSYIASVTGESDVMMEYIYEDNNDLLEFLKFMKNRQEIRRLNSRTILKIHKAQYPIRVKP